LIKQRTVSLPPALIITAQLIAGSLSGSIGLALATLLTAVVLARELYVKEAPRTAGIDQGTSAE
jgi:predicted PurR-regulated permease PerM